MATPAQSRRIPTHEPERRRRLSLPAARDAPPASSPPFPPPGPSQRLPSWNCLLGYCLFGGYVPATKARSTSHARGHVPSCSLPGAVGEADLGPSLLWAGAEPRGGVRPRLALSRR